MPCSRSKEVSGMLDPREGHTADSQVGKINTHELMKTTVLAKWQVSVQQGAWEILEEE